MISVTDMEPGTYYRGSEDRELVSSQPWVKIEEPGFSPPERYIQVLVVKDPTDEEMLQALYNLYADYSNSCGGRRSFYDEDTISKYFNNLPSQKRRSLITNYAYEMFGTPEAIGQGYGHEDMAGFLRFVLDDVGIL